MATPRGETPFPCTYRVRAGWRAVTFVVGMGIAVFMAWSAAFFLDRYPIFGRIVWVPAGVAVIAALAALVEVVDTSITRIVLADDAIELRDIRGRRRLRRRQIARRKVIRGVLVIEPREGTKARSISLVPALMQTDKALEEWIATLPA